MEFKLKQEVLNKVLNYLASKPFVEVAGLIQEVRTATPIKEVKVEEVKETKDKK